MYRFNLKRIMAVMLCLIMCLSMHIPVSASNNTREEKIGILFDKMTENLAEYLLDDNSENAYNIQAKTAEIENELSLMGVQKLSDEELHQFLADKGIPSTKVSKPADTNTVNWYLNTYSNYTSGSQKYDIQNLIAVGNNPGGMLITGADNVEFYSKKQKLANAVKNAINIYAQKAIGTIPVIQWTPYELLFSNSASNVFNSNYVTHRCVSSIEFSFVKKSSQSDDYYSLCKFSNKLSIAVNTHGAAVVNSQPKTYSKNTNKTISSDNYNSVSSAVHAYANNYTNHDYISYYNIESYDGEYSKKAYVPNPMAGPGQIY